MVRGHLGAGDEDIRLENREGEDKAFVGDAGRRCWKSSVGMNMRKEESEFLGGQLDQVNLRATSSPTALVPAELQVRGRTRGTR